MEWFVDFCLTVTNGFYECREFKSEMEKKQGMFMELEQRNEITETLVYELCGGRDRVVYVAKKFINSK